MSTQRHWFTVMTREMVVRGLSKGFLLSSAAMTLTMAAVVAFLFLQMNGSADRIAVVDAQGQGIIAAANQQAEAANQDAPFEAVTVAGRPAAEDAVAAGDAKAALLRSGDGWEFIVKEFGPSTSSAQRTLTIAAQQSITASNAHDQGVDLAKLMEGTAVTARALDGSNDESSFLMWMITLSFGALFMTLALLYGMQIAQSVVEEKQSRIVEILISAIPVRDLLVGKIAANTLLAFGQIALTGAVALIGLSRTDLAITLPGLSQSIVWFVVFFVAGFLALACIWAAAGAMATRQEDLSQTTMPLTMILMGSYLAAALVSDASAREVLSWIPILSTSMMPARILAGEAAWWEALLALALVLVFCAATLLFGARVYRRGILSGRAMGVGEVWRTVLAR